MTEPPVLDRYFAAEDAGDWDSLASCFTEDGVVTDDGEDYRGRPEIRRWRELNATRWTYTSELLGVEPADDLRYVAVVHLEGDFPGGVIDLRYRFTLDHDLISHLVIAP